MKRHLWMTVFVLSLLASPAAAQDRRDTIDPQLITFVDNPADLGSWPITASLTRIQFRPDAMIVDFDRRQGPDAWPNRPFDAGAPPDPNGGGIQYTLGLCFNRGGHWYCSAAIQFWQGRELEAGASPSSIPNTWYYDGRWAPMNGYLPADGEPVGVFVVAGNVRGLHDGGRLIARERSNIVLVPFNREIGPLPTPPPPPPPPAPVPAPPPAPPVPPAPVPAESLAQIEAKLDAIQVTVSRTYLSLEEHRRAWQHVLVEVAKYLGPIGAALIAGLQVGK